MVIQVWGNNKGGPETANRKRSGGCRKEGGLGSGVARKKQRRKRERRKKESKRGIGELTRKRRKERVDRRRLQDAFQIQIGFVFSFLTCSASCTRADGRSNTHVAGDQNS